MGRKDQERPTEHEREYYEYGFMLGGEPYYILWFRNSRDGVVVGDSGDIICFRSVESLRAYANGVGVSLEPTDPELLDFDRALAWSANPSGNAIEAKLLLDIWNLIDDARTSMFDLSDVSLGPDEDLNLYDKLFWATNPPSLTPEGASFRPAWSQAELARLSEVIRHGITAIRSKAAVLG